MLKMTVDRRGKRGVLNRVLADRLVGYLARDVVHPECGSWDR